MKEFGSYEPYIHSNTDTFVLFTGLFVRPVDHAPLKMELKDIIIPLPKPKINEQ